MRTTRTEYEARTRYGVLIRTFETADLAEVWERSSPVQGARVEVVTTTVVRLPIHRNLRLVNA